MADDVINTLIAEAYAEGPEGMRRVAETILNRAAIRGISPEEVVRQARQYTGYEKPGSEARQAQQSPKARAAAQAAYELAMQPGDPTGGADHYFNPNVVSPRWANAMAPKGDYGNHRFFSSRPVPPGELNQLVGTLLDTAPSRAVVPATPSANLAALRNAPRSMAGRNLGDTLAMSPLRGGAQASPMFDGEYSPRLGGMTRMPAPAQTWGMNPSRTPYPAQQSPQLAGARVAASRPNAQVAANTAAAARRPAARLPDIPPSRLGEPPATRRVATAQVRPTTTASDRVRGNAAQTQNVATTVASIPTSTPRAQISASDMVRGRSVPGAMTVEQMYAGIYPTEPGSFRIGGSAPNLPTRAPRVGLAPSQVGQIGVLPSGAPTPIPRPATFGTTLPPRTSPFPMPASMRPSIALAPTPAKIAPVPFMRPAGLGSPAPVVAPVPRTRPAAFAAPLVRAPLNIVVQGSRTLQPVAPPPVQPIRLTPAQAYALANSRSGYSNSGTSDRTRDRDGSDRSGLTG